MRVFKDADFKFLGQRRYAYMVSGVLVLAGILSILLFRGIDYSVEFTGGTLMQVQFTEALTVADVRDGLTVQGITGAQIQRFGGENEFVIRLQEFEGVGEDRDMAGILRDALATQFGEGNLSIERTEAVGPAVGEELQVKAATAILLSFLLTLIYLAFRFEWIFGVAAVIATLHDIVLTFGFMSMLGIEISLATVAAILTIVGYSLNDTIVTFDRMRENLQTRRKEPYDELLNRSINEVLPRTFMTSFSTLLALGALFVFGGAVIRPFTVVLILGVLVGTYSSIYVASPALLEIKRFQDERERRRARASA